MNRSTRYTAIVTAGLLIIMSAAGCSRRQPLPPPVPPDAEQRPRELTIHGHTRIDNYYWLNQRDDPAVIAYLEAENRYKDAMLAHTGNLQRALYDEIVDRFPKSDESVPYLDNGYYYTTRFEKDAEYPLYVRTAAGDGGREEIILDVNALAAGYRYYAAAELTISPDNRYLCFGEDTLSRRKYTIRIKDLETGDMLADRIPNTTANAVWANDSRTLFYATKDSTLRPDKIWRHRRGTDPSQDELVYHEKDNTFDVHVTRSKSGVYIFINATSTLSSEVWFLEADTPAETFRRFQRRGDDFEYSVFHRGDLFYILTNHKAENFKLMTAPTDRYAKRYWRELIPHRHDVLLQNLELFNDYLVLQERKEGLNHLRIIDQESGEDHYIEFREDAYVASISVNKEMDSDVLRYSYSSLTTPNSTFDYTMNTRETRLLKEEPVLGGFDKNDYSSERVFARADDGTMVPVSLVYRKGMQKNGRNPLLLYGYGSYGYSMEPRFSSVRLSLLDRGFIYAIAHIRGGQEMGRFWYEEGKLFNKRNTFTDFINCAEYLVHEQYTSPAYLFAEGGSAGGLLMGAVINMAPELFNGVIASVPFVDVVTTMLDETIPLTTSEYDEWGNPNKKEYYDYMLSYSPYDNVTARDYPALLVTTGLHDSQVQYWEPAKWVAKLRDLKTDDNPLLFHINMDYGHGGASGRFQRYREVAMEYAFLLDRLGIHK
ncbi:S9 family peptidase [bacterium]|nr:S9 family peptidase [bacterium]